VKLKCFNAVFALLLALAMPASGQDSLAVSKIASLYDFWGSVEAVAVQGNFAYVTTVPAGLWILNVANPASPVVLSKCQFNGEAGKVALRSGYAYVTAGNDGVKVIDVNPAASPAIVNTLNIDGYVTDLEIQDSLMMVIVSGSAGQPGMYFFHLTDPESPAPAGQITGLLNAAGVEMQADYIYVADYLSGLSIYEYLSPGVNFIGSIELAGFPIDLAVSSDYAFIADFGTGIRAIDIQNPALPVEAGCYTTANSLFSLICAADTVYCCMGTDGIEVIDFSIPAAPELIAEYDSPGSATAAYKNVNKIYLADGGKGMKILSISALPALQLLGSIDRPGFLDNIEFMNDCAFITDGDLGIRIVNVDQPSSPVESSTYPASEVISDFLCEGGLLYFAAGDTLNILDVTNTQNPLLMSQTVLDGYTSCVELWSHYLFAAGDDFIIIINVQNPLQPVLVSQISGLTNLADIAVQDELLLAITIDNDLYAYDISIINDPTIISQTSGNSDLIVSSLKIKDNYALACGYWEIGVYDISDPSAMVELPNFGDFNGILDMEIAGDHLFVANYDRISLYNFINPNDNTLIGWYDNYGWAMSIAAEGNNVFLADGFEFGVYDAAEALIVDPAPWNEGIARTVQLAPLYPNPFNSSMEITYTVNRPGVGDIWIFDVQGREVRHLFHGSMPAGESRLNWNADNLTSGVYFIRLQQNGGSVVRKAALVK